MKLWSALTELWTTTERFSASCVGLYSWNGKLNLRDLMKRNPSDACSEIKTLFFPLRAHVGIRKNLCFCVTTAATLCFGLNECFYTSELICREKFADKFFFSCCLFLTSCKVFRNEYFIQSLRFMVLNEMLITPSSKPGEAHQLIRNLILNTWRCRSSNQIQIVSFRASSACELVRLISFSRGLAKQLVTPNREKFPSKVREKDFGSPEKRGNYKVSRLSSTGSEAQSSIPRKPLNRETDCFRIADNFPHSIPVHRRMPFQCSFRWNGKNFLHSQSSDVSWCGRESATSFENKKIIFFSSFPWWALRSKQEEEKKEKKLRKENFEKKVKINKHTTIYFENASFGPSVSRHKRSRKMWKIFTVGWKKWAAGRVWD